MKIENETGNLKCGSFCWQDIDTIYLYHGSSELLMTDFDHLDTKYACTLFIYTLSVLLHTYSP